MTNRITFLLGAGAAMPWGGPSTNELTELIIKKCTFRTKSGKNAIEYLLEIIKNKYDYTSSINFETVVSLIEVLYEYYDIKSISGTSPNRHPIWPKLFLITQELENELFDHYKLFDANSALDADGESTDIYDDTKMINNIPVVKSVWKSWLLSRIYLAINNIITDRILEYDNDKQVEKYEHTRLMKQFINYYRRDNKIARFYTTNYDNLLPKINKNLNFFNGFESNNYDEVINENKILKDMSISCYYSLHGSIYWDTYFDDHKRLKEVYKFVPSPPYFIYGPKREVVDSGKHVIFTNILMGGSKTQKTYIEPMNYFESAFSNDCRNSDIIYVIGSSLGDYDIRKAIKIALTDESKILVIITKGNDIDTYKSLIESVSSTPTREYLSNKNTSNPWLKNSKGNCYVYCNGFDEFLKNEEWNNILLG